MVSGKDAVLTFVAWVCFQILDIARHLLWAVDLSDLSRTCQLEDAASPAGWW